MSADGEDRAYLGSLLAAGDLEGAADFAETITDERAGRRLARAVQWLADNSLIDDDAASRYLAGHPDPHLP